MSLDDAIAQFRASTIEFARVIEEHQRVAEVFPRLAHNWADVIRRLDLPVVPLLKPLEFGKHNGIDRRSES